jgi:hypothetical protein
VKGAIAHEAPAPETRRAGGTRSSLPRLSRSRGLLFASAEAMASQSAGSAMSSKRSMGGKRERMIRWVRSQVTRRRAISPASALGIEVIAHAEQVGDLAAQHHL